VPPSAEPPWTADSFAHARHTRLACITCHDPNSKQKLTFAPPRGCQICHHQAPERNDCARCHTPAELSAAAPAVTVTVAVKNSAPRPREVRFDHAAHASQNCISCHVTAVSMAPAAETATCARCHDQHAGTTVTCANCHASPVPLAAHTPPADAHRGCVACHAEQIVATLTPTRTLCLTCHAPQRDHMPDAECTKCHLQATPEEYRPRLSASR